MSIELTEKAAQRVQTMIAKRGHGVGLRLKTRSSGCSGFAYVVDYADSIDEGDQVFESRGVKVIIDQHSQPLLRGTRVDYVKLNALNEGFEFINPNARNMCGCGESFTV